MAFEVLLAAAEDVVVVDVVVWAGALAVVVDTAADVIVVVEERGPLNELGPFDSDIVSALLSTSDNELLSVV